MESLDHGKQKCIICSENAEIHHIYTRGSHPEYKDSKWNHMLLCRKHHTEIHRIGRTSFVKKYQLQDELIRRGFEFCEFRNKWIIIK